MAQFFDWSKKRRLDRPGDGCTFAEWPAQFTTAAFAKHPGGFTVFLPPDKLACDEYAEGDPYGVETDIDNDWHRRRFTCTLGLLKKAVATRADEDLEILDLGCGRGFITAAVKETLPAARVYGLDYSLRAIEYAASRFRNVELVVADAYSSPFAPASFDVVICNNIWEHVDDPLAMLASVRRILKSRGYLIISTPSRYRVENLLRAVLGKSCLLISPLHVTEYSVGQVSDQLRWGKLDLVEVTSEKIKGEFSTIRLPVRVVFGVAQPILRMYIKAVGSHHSIEGTVFYLARRTD
jgi:2-polyprenyl-3-methyl-5-hydroxy-6-metoxy-1,4-benzoquinol methylase